MSKTKFVLLLFLVLVPAAAIHAQSSDNVTIKVAVVDKALNLKNVPKFALAIRKDGDIGFGERRVSTSLDGVASLALSQGEYVVSSVDPLVFEDRTFSWAQPFTVHSSQPVKLEL